MRKALLIVIAVAALLLVVSALLNGHGSTPAPPAAEELALHPASDVEAGIFADSSDRWNNILPDMPEPTVKLKIRRPLRLAETFNDSNYVQWAEAEKIGITPLTDTRSHYRPGRGLRKVASNPDFYLDNLTHSAPYLVPEAADMLHEIGRRFNDSLRARGGGPYRIRVTSVLRTPENVSRLRRANRNAVDSSVHQFGTTVDITYARFACDSKRGPNRSAEDLKNLLGEVLYAMREEGKVWVKYERQQPCYHITVRQH